MLLTYKDCSVLKGKEWCMLEVRSEKTIEPTLRRIGKAIPSIFLNEAVEIFIPVGKRDLDIFDLEAAAYLFVRSTSFPGLLRLKTITGVVSLVTEGDSNRPSKVIKVEDSFVQEQIKAAEKRFHEHSVGVAAGSFVRVLNGETRDFCGTVKAMADGKAIVRIRLKTKSIMLETPVSNLLNLSHVLPELRTYYYCPLVTSLQEGGKEALSLLGNDSSPGEPVPFPPLLEKRPVREAPKRLRQRTVTALVKKLILIDQMHVPLDIAKKTVEAIKAGAVRSPKNLFIVYTIIKDSLMKYHFGKESPELKNYRDVVEKYGDAYKFSARQIARLDLIPPVPLGSKKG